ncbi:MAG: hypothetical protein JSW47_05635 [Phycisphaerales bacterium]|nr:MAG: hypothetical protein JSW47_05635 [Phycisphaerales bacterium]
MIIAGYRNGQTVEVLDRGGAIRGNRLDVFFNSHQEAWSEGALLTRDDLAFRIFFVSTRTITSDLNILRQADRA